MNPKTSAIGTAIYDAANLNPAAPPQGVTATLAELIYGDDIYYEQAGARRWADVVTLGGRRRMLIRKGLNDEALNWAIGWSLTYLFVESEPWFTALDRYAQRRVCGEVAAWLTAPDAAFDAAYERHGLDLRAIANRFVIQETAVALRIAESGAGPRCAVVTQRRVYRRGLLEGFDDATARELARVRRPRSVIRVAVRDEPGRVALFSKTG